MVSLSLQCLVEHCRYIHIYSVSTLHTGQTTRTEYSGERIFIKMAFPNHLSQEITLEHFSQQLAQSSPDSTEKTPEHHHPPQQPPTRLNSATLRQQSHYDLQTNSGLTTTMASNQWLSRTILQRSISNVSNDSMMSADINVDNDDTRVVGSKQVENNGGAGVGGGGGGGVVNWENAREKSAILTHPLYEQLLSAHVGCLRIATPVDQLARIDAQLAQSQHVVAKYSSQLGHGNVGGQDDKELDQFMTHYVLLLCSFKEQLQQHVRVHAMEAVMACWEIEQSLQSLTGVSPGEGTGATMSDDNDDQIDSDTNFFDGSLEGHDSMNYGPLVPTESERSLMERVRQELKHELKEGYKEKIVDIREEILRKRRAGKLPGDTTSVLKAWWQTHAKWPYPTEEDKARLVQETGLQLKQINNWFINQRKRNWHSNPSTSMVLKCKRKSNAGGAVIVSHE